MTPTNTSQSSLTNARGQPLCLIRGLAHTFGWLRINRNTWEKPNGELVAFPFATEPVVMRYHSPIITKDTKTQR